MATRFAMLCLAPDWVSPPRTARQLMLHGAEVCIVSPPDTYAALTRFKTADILLPAEDIRTKLPAIVRTIAEDFAAHSILAGDTRAFVYLAQLAGRIGSLGASDAVIELMRRSMPNSATAALIASDSQFITSRADDACAPPPTIANPPPEEALHFAATHGFPVVAKCDGSAAGKGVSICATEVEVLAAIKAMSGDFVLQCFVEGQVYGVAVSGAAGRVAGAISFAKHQVWPTPHGAATVLRCEQRDDIIAHATRQFEQLGLNGFAGFDYILDPNGRAHLIEINPYIVEGHISGVFGCDLTAALLAQIEGRASVAPRPPDNEYVAFFPTEWRRSPSSPYISTAHHDVPWDDPELLAAMVRDSMAAPATADAKLTA